MSEKNEKQEAIERAIQELMEQVEEMPVGGNLMNILEREIPKLNRLIVERSVEKRGEINQVREDDFPPSGDLSEVREGGADDEGGKV